MDEFSATGDTPLVTAAGDTPLVTAAAVNIVGSVVVIVAVLLGDSVVTVAMTSEAPPSCTPTWQ